MPLSNVVSKTHSTALKTPLGSILLLKSPLFSICILKHNRSSSYLCVCGIDHFSKQLLHKTVPLFPKQHLLFWQVSLHLPVASKLHMQVRGNVVSISHLQAHCLCWQSIPAASLCRDVQQVMCCMGVVFFPRSSAPTFPPPLPLLTLDTHNNDTKKSSMQWKKSRRTFLYFFYKSQHIPHFNNINLNWKKKNKTKPSPPDLFGL